MNGILPAGPPAQVRTVLWQCRFTGLATKRATGAWWRREGLGLFAGTVIRGPDGRTTLRLVP